MYWPRDRKSRGWIIRKGIHPRLWRSDSELNALLSRRDLTPAEAREADRILGDIEAQPPLPPGPPPPLDGLGERRWHGFLDRQSFTPAVAQPPEPPGPPPQPPLPLGPPPLAIEDQLRPPPPRLAIEDQNRKHEGNKMTGSRNLR